MTDLSSPGGGVSGAEVPGPAPSGPVTLPADWPAKAADTVELLVAALNDRAVRPVLVAARALVFGVLMVALTVALVVWFSIGLIRFMDVYFWPGEVWISYLLTGSVFTIGGLVVWHFRLPTAGGAGAGA
jgi:hypothetical protein